MMGDFRVSSNVDATKERRVQSAHGSLCTTSITEPSTSTRRQLAISTTLTADCLATSVSGRSNRFISCNADMRYGGSCRRPSSSVIQSNHVHSSPAAERQQSAKPVTRRWSAVVDVHYPRTADSGDEEEEGSASVERRIASSTPSSHSTRPPLSVDSSASIPPIRNPEMWSLFADHVRSITSNGAVVDFAPKQIPKTTSDHFRQVRDDLTAEAEVPITEHLSPTGNRPSTTRRWRNTWQRAVNVGRAIQAFSKPAGDDRKSTTSTTPAPPTTAAVAKPEVHSTLPKSRGWRILRRLLNRERMARMMIPSYVPWSILESRSTRSQGMTAAEAWHTRCKLYERYVEGTDSWEDGLSESGSDRLHSLQHMKRVLRRFPVTCSPDMTSRQRAMSALPAPQHGDEKLRRHKAVPIVRARSAVVGRYQGRTIPESLSIREI